MIRKTEEQKRRIAENRDAFNKGIRLLKYGQGDEGRLSLNHLKRLNSVYKKDYTAMIMEEAEEVKAYV